MGAGAAAAASRLAACASPACRCPGVGPRRGAGPQASRPGLQGRAGPGKATRALSQHPVSRWLSCSLTPARPAGEYMKDVRVLNGDEQRGESKGFEASGTECSWLRWGGTSGCHLVRPSFSGRGRCSLQGVGRCGCEATLSPSKALLLLPNARLDVICYSHIPLTTGMCFGKCGEWGFDG